MQTVELFLDLFPSVVFAPLMLVYFILNLRREMKKEMDALRKKIPRPSRGCFFQKVLTDQSLVVSIFLDCSQPPIFPQDIYRQLQDPALCVSCCHRWHSVHMKPSWLHVQVTLGPDGLTRKSRGLWTVRIYSTRFQPFSNQLQISGKLLPWASI